jgi:hypothetical protein
MIWLLVDIEINLRCPALCGKPSRAVLSLAALVESIQTGKEEMPPWLIPAPLKLMGIASYLNVIGEASFGPHHLRRRELVLTFVDP